MENLFNNFINIYKYKYKWNIYLMILITKILKMLSK